MAVLTTQNTGGNGNQLIKNIVFVRHAESYNNICQEQYGENVELTPEGIKQAIILSDKLFYSKFEVIVSSPLKRAISTARILNRVIRKDILTTDLCIERKRPTELAFLSKNDSRRKKILEEIDARFFTDQKLSDEENFSDLIVRAKSFLNFLNSLPALNILCVSHGYFLTFIYCWLVLNRFENKEIFINMFANHYLENCKMMHISLDYNLNVDIHCWNC